MSVKEIREALKRGDIEEVKRIKNRMINRNRLSTGFLWGQAKTSGYPYVDNVLERLKKERKS